MDPNAIILVAAADKGLRLSCEFVLRGQGLQVESLSDLATLIAHPFLDAVPCTVVDEDLLGSSGSGLGIVRRLGKPCVLLLSGFHRFDLGSLEVALDKPIAGDALVVAVLSAADLGGVSR
jgi:hypothetical protein